MKNPEEIKKGLECGFGVLVACGACGYKNTPECNAQADADAFDYIHQLEEALLLMVYQYCNEGDSVSHRFMTAGEHAFAALGIENYCDIEKIEKMLDEMEGRT